MRLRVLALVLVPLHSGGAIAGPTAAGSLIISDRPDTPRARLNFRLVQDAEPSTSPVHNSGMIAHTSVSRNAVIGVGLLKAAAKKPGSGEWRHEGAAPRSRKAAVTFQLRF